MTNQLRIKRIYLAPDENDGLRILIDRLWPRGVSKVHARVDAWIKDIAPSTELRKWFGHEPVKWDRFTAAYIKELTTNPAVKDIREYMKVNKVVTLLYAAKNEEYNHAIVLTGFLRKYF